MTGSSENQCTQNDRQDDALDQGAAEPKPSETGMHGTLPVEDQSGGTSYPLARVTKIAALATLAAAVAATTVNNFDLKTNPESKKTAGDGEEEDLCGVQTFAADAKPEDMAKHGEDKCQFVLDPNGTMHVIGHTLIDADGKPNDCYLQPAWSPDAILKIRGQISGRIDQPGRIRLDQGKLCVMMKHENNPEYAESVVAGEAALHITTTGKVLVKMLYSGPNDELHYVLVAPVLGETLITQEGRGEQILLKEGDRPVKIPLDKVAYDGGCYVARPGREGGTGGEETGGDGSEILLTASAILLGIRRRRV